MPATTTPVKAPRLAHKPSTSKPVKSAVKPAKPTKWGTDMLAKMEAFRKALAAQQ